MLTGTGGRLLGVDAEHRGSCGVLGLDGTRAEPPDVSVISDEVAFGQLAEEWDDLVHRCASSTPFQTHAWLSSWWGCYGTVGRLRVLVARNGTQLVAAVALFLTRRRGRPRASAGRPRPVGLLRCPGSRR
jgi:CelD/BcsL family acetyltransferase involved in cellulose biosynthesis